MRDSSLLRKSFFPLEYGLARGLIAGMQALPLPAALRAAEHVGGLIYRGDRRHREVARTNLRAVHPQWSPEQIDHVARSSFSSLARTALELAYLPRLVTPSRWQECIEFPDRAWVEEFVASGPAILVTGHVGNWEVLGNVLGFLGFETHSIARRLDNPLLNDYCERLRQHRKQRIIYKHGAVKTMSGLLRQGEKLGFLIDQNAGRRGVYCDFLGRRASTTSIPALLAQRLRVPILPGFAVRTGKQLEWKVIACQPIRPEHYEHLSTRDAIAAMTAEATRQVEKVVRAYPEQWMWMHRRWRSRPPEERLQPVVGTETPAARRHEPSPSRLSGLPAAAAMVGGTGAVAPQVG